MCPHSISCEVQGGDYAPAAVCAPYYRSSRAAGRCLAAPCFAWHHLWVLSPAATRGTPSGSTSTSDRQPGRCSRCTPEPLLSLGTGGTFTTAEPIYKTCREGTSVGICPLPSRSSRSEIFTVQSTDWKFLGTHTYCLEICISMTPYSRANKAKPVSIAQFKRTMCLADLTRKDEQ